MHYQGTHTCVFVFMAVSLHAAGEGVPLIVEVAKPEQAQRGVFFGAVSCSSCCSRTLPLVNRGKAAAHISFTPCADLLERLGIEIIPAEGITLKAKQAAEVTLLYRSAGPGRDCVSLHLGAV